MLNFRVDEEERCVFEVEIFLSNLIIQVEDFDKFRKQNIFIYVGFVVGIFILVYVSVVVFFFIVVFVLQNFYNNMFRKFFGVKIYFFDINFVGKCFLKCWMINNVCIFFLVILVF